MIATLSQHPTAAATHDRAPGADSPAAPPTSDWLQFLDGSALHGRLSSVDHRNDVRWQYPAAKEIIVFSATNIASIGFENSPVAPPVSPLACRVRFRNGDELLGTLSSLDDDTLGLETWFAGPLKAARRAVQTITFLPRGFKVRYEGPTGLEGWRFGRDPQPWQYRDGSFIVTGAGSLARDFQLEGSSSLEFDLAWTSTFELILVLYTEVLDRLDYNASSYLVYLGTGFVNLQRVQAGFGVLQLGQAQLTDLLKKNHAHFELRVLKDEATLELRIDGALVGQWKDPRGFAARGPGIVFLPQELGSTGRLSLSSLRVCTWDAAAESDVATNAPTTNDWIHLVNRDHVAGTLRTLRDGKLTVATAQTTLDIPLSRVTQIVLNHSNADPPMAGVRETRVHFSGGGTLSFQLEQWDPQRISGSSAVFGRLSFPTDPVRRLQFNPDRAGALEPGASAKDREVWDE